MLRKEKYLFPGHIIRSDHYHFQHIIFQGKIEGGKQELQRRKKEITRTKENRLLNWNWGLPAITDSRNNNFSYIFFVTMGRISKLRVNKQ